MLHGPTLRALQNPRYILGDGVRRDEDELGGEALRPCELCLIDRGGRPERRLHGERAPLCDVLLYESLALFRDGTPDFTWNRSIASKDLCTPIVGIERIGAEGRHR